MCLHIIASRTAVTFHHHHRRILQVTEPRTDLVLKARYQQEVQTAFHHKTVTRSAIEILCSFQVEVDVLHHTRCVGTMGTMFSTTPSDAASDWFCCSSHRKRSLSSLDIATSPQNLPTMLKRTRKERVGRGHSSHSFSPVALADRELWNFSLVSSTKSFK